MFEEIIQKIEKLDRSTNATFGDAYKIAEMFNDVPENDETEKLALSKVQSIIDRYYTLKYIKSLDGCVLSSDALKMMSFASAINSIRVKRTWTHENIVIDGQKKMVTIQIYIAVLMDFTECIFCNVLVA